VIGARTLARRVAGPMAAFAVALALAACSTNGETAAPTFPVSTSATVETPTAAPPSFGPPPSPTPDDAAPVVLDPSLLDLLPATVGSTPVTEDADAAAQTLTDPALDQLASAVDAAVAVDLGNGDLVYAVVVRVKPGVFGDEVYRQWRDSYDEGACAASGGVVGHAEATIGGRQTFVTSCVQGMHTYHVWLDSLSVIISASSIGDSHFGEQLLQGLRLPG
jgi:hypothetical protein